MIHGAAPMPLDVALAKKVFFFFRAALTFEQVSLRRSTTSRWFAAGRLARRRRIADPEVFLFVRRKRRRFDGRNLRVFVSHAQRTVPTTAARLVPRVFLGGAEPTTSTTTPRQTPTRASYSSGRKPRACCMDYSER